MSFTLRKGQILGITGLVGCGRSELARLVAGAQAPSAGELLLNGETLALRDPRDALNRGIGFLPPDRRRQGCILDFSLRENLTLPNLRPYWSHGWFDFGAERTDVERVIHSFNIRPPLAERPIRLFSGGNQQKALVARCIRLGIAVMVVDEPTQGVDVGGKREIGRMLREFADSGHGIILASSDYDEIGELCDQVLVLDRGRTIGIFDPREMSEHQLSVVSDKYREHPQSRAMQG